MSAPVARVLREAAAELETNGWCQGDMFKGQQSCLVGSVYRVLGISDSKATIPGHIRAQAREAINPVFEHLGPAAQWGIVHWNDTPGRTQAEVVKELLTVADLEDVR